jgi:uncharacterized membrane protein (DUF106 family)
MNERQEEIIKGLETIFEMETTEFVLLGIELLLVVIVAAIIVAIILRYILGRLSDKEEDENLNT